jgi:predicted metalloprotease
MQWTPGESSGDIEDRRDESGAGGGGFGAGGGFGGIHLGIGGTIIVGLLSLVFHDNLFQYFSGAGSGPAAAVRSQPNPSRTKAEEPEKEFLEFAIKDIQDTWDRMLPEQNNARYRHAKLVLYRDAYPSGCGTARTATGPFYCPEDEKVYLDLGFFHELKTRFGAPGEFAQAYVIAHEIGHHVQKILGIETKVRRLQQQNPDAVNPLSVRLELQADCFAGVWGHSSEQRKVTDQDDVSAGMKAAAAVGDDRLQRAGQGYVNPETFTHGSSAQRVGWFRRGLKSGLVSDCNTFRRSGQ